MDNSSKNERALALKALLKWQKNEVFLKQNELPPFAMELALGVCRYHLCLQYIIKKNAKKIPPLEVQMILEMGLYQLFFTDIPSYAILSSAVELAKKISPQLAQFTNAFLRCFEERKLPELPSHKILNLSIKYSIPEFLVRRFLDIYGFEKTELLGKKKLQKPSEWIRVNLTKISLDDFFKEVQLLRDLTILQERFILLPPEISLRDLLQSSAFKKGFFSVQNPAAFDVVRCLNLKPKERVWDACAAPGGKSALMAEIEPSLEIYASDISEERVKKMDDLKTRLNLNLQTAKVDVLNHSFVEEFDKILLDVPCSNLGVMHRRPESIYRLSLEKLKETAAFQMELLENAIKALKKGGILVYATCSLDPMETTQIINAFLKKHPEFSKGSVFKGEAENIDGFFAQALILSDKS